MGWIDTSKWAKGSIGLKRSRILIKFNVRECFIKQKTTWANLYIAGNHAKRTETGQFWNLFKWAKPMEVSFLFGHPRLQKIMMGLHHQMVGHVGPTAENFQLFWMSSIMVVSLLFSLISFFFCF